VLHGDEDGRREYLGDIFYQMCLCRAEDEDMFDIHIQLKNSDQEDGKESRDRETNVQNDVDDVKYEIFQRG
jgi:hypothetical protein